jgi:hypothetical protein
MWREGIEQLADALPGGFDGTFGSLAQEQFELGEHLLDRIEIWAVGRQEQEPGTCGPVRISVCGRA